jgi:hypothetical protein
MSPAKDLFSHELSAGWTSPTSWTLAYMVLPLGDPLIVMVQPTHDGKRDYLVPCTPSRWNQSALFRYLLPNPLMRSCLVEVGDIGIEHALELLLLKDQQMIEAFLSDAPHEAFADGIGSGCMIGGFEYFNRTRFRHTSKARPELTVVITNQVLGCLSIWGRFSQLLGHPGIGRRVCHAHMDHLA